MTIAPTSGRKMTSVSQEPVGHRLPPQDHEVRAGHGDQPEGDAQRVVLDAAGLDPGQAAAAPAGERADAVDDAVDDVSRSNQAIAAASRPPMTTNSRWLMSSNHHLLADARYRKCSRLRERARRASAGRRARSGPSSTPNRRHAASMPATRHGDADQRSGCRRCRRARTPPRGGPGAPRRARRSGAASRASRPSPSTPNSGPSGGPGQVRTTPRMTDGIARSHSGTVIDPRRLVDLRLDRLVDPALAPERHAR